MKHRAAGCLVAVAVGVVAAGCGTGTTDVSTAPTRAVTSAPATTASKPGRELFRHATPDGRRAMIGRVVQYDEVCPSPRGTVFFCNGDGPLLFLDQVVDGRVFVAESGGAMPRGEASRPIHGGEGGSGPTPYVTLYVSPAVAKVTVALRQADGTTVTDEMVPVDGVVAFAAPIDGKLLGPAIALDADGAPLASEALFPG